MSTTEAPPAPTSQVLDDYETLCVRERRRTRMVMRLPKAPGVWQRSQASVERETHTYYVGGKYAGSVYRDGEAWAWCFAGHGDDIEETAGLESGKAAVERGPA